MAVASGTKLGPYEIVAPLGAGGMGEVYRARDTRLNRTVAIKVLPDQLALDPDRLRRFDQEARVIAAISHPNILALYDVGTSGQTAYLVSEYLEGNTLRERLRGGALTRRRACEWAAQIANGLSAAHDQGITHRDLKPENIFITRDDHVKILDFGLAKLSRANAEAETLAATAGTTPGLVMGTVGYMSPEQVRGDEVDYRTDIFAFGAILYEMLSGQRAFHRDTGPETMTAILKEEPPALTTLSSSTPPAIESIVGRCLDKNPNRRFQSAKDLAFALEAVSGGTSATAAPASLPKPWRSYLGSISIVSLLLLTGVAGYFFGLRGKSQARPSFLRLTRTRGSIETARFAGDGQTVVFSAAWNGQPTRLFFQTLQSKDSTALPTGDGTQLFSVSNTGELAIGLHSVQSSYWTFTGTLAQISLTGGAPREVLDDVEDADWSPDGTNFAVVRHIGRHFRLEFPIGRVLYETEGYISHIRFSSTGDRIAFMDHPAINDNRGAVSVVDLKGQRKVLTRLWGSEMGLGWSPTGNELWFGAELGDEGYALRAVDLDGRERVLLAAPVSLFPQDVSRTGQLLLTTEETRIDVFTGNTTGGGEKDLTSVVESWAHRISSDGSFFIFNTGDYDIYLRKADGTPAAKLGKGQIYDLSPDGKWVLSIMPSENHKLLLIPTGAGEVQVLSAGTLHYISAHWLPTTQRVLVSASDDSGMIRTYSQELSGGQLKPVSPPDVSLVLAAPDGRSFLGVTSEKQYRIYSLDEGGGREVAGIAADESPIQWLDDNRTLLVRRRPGIPVPVYKVDVVTGRRTLWKQFDVADKVGVNGIGFISVSRDGAHYLYAPGHAFSVLYSVEGIH
jgi:eukaryotic-like serine/threonine-protein kinase